MSTAKSRAMLVLALMLGATLVVSFAMPSLSRADIITDEGSTPGTIGTGDPDMPDTAPPKSSGGSYRTGTGWWYTASGGLYPVSRTSVSAESASAPVSAHEWLASILGALRAFWGL